MGLTRNACLVKVFPVRFLSHLELQKRWVKHKQLGIVPAMPVKIGVDVAGMGVDSTCFCDRMGDFVIHFDKYQSGGLRP